MKELMKTYSEIEVYLGRQVELLNELQQVEDAKVLKNLQQKYRDVITEWMKENDITKLQYFHDQSIGVQYSILGEQNEK